jgi:broad specificity phosphatase PhoE
VARERLYLVRHAEVVVDPAKPAHEWTLSEEGMADAARLAEARSWQGLSVVATSEEPKARETGRPIAAAAGVDRVTRADLGEVRRGESWVVGACRYITLVERYFAEPEQPPLGWEPAAVAQTRVVRCAEDLLAEAAGSVSVVSHGLLLSLYVASLSGRSAPALEEWKSIPLPGVAVVDPAARELLTPFLSVDAFLDWEGRH